MGKSSLIIVMGMSVIVAFFILKLNANSKENLSTTVNMFEQTQARLIANSGVEIWLEKLFADNSLINTTTSSQSLFNGEYKVNMKGTLPFVRVTSTATFGDATHVSVADAELEPIDFPQLPGGMHISTAALTGVAFLGNMEINGKDHDIYGDDKNNGEGVVGVSVDTQEQKALIDEYLTKPQAKPDQLIGRTGETTFGSPSYGVTNIDLGQSWAQIYQWLANAADVTFMNQSPSKTLGTLEQPQITLVVNTDDTKDITIAANTTGAGILVVHGNVKFAGGLNFKGIVLSYKSTNIDLEVTSVGTNQVLGGMIVAGQSVSYKGGGTMDVKYSSDVLNLIKANYKKRGFRILRWYE